MKFEVGDVVQLKSGGPKMTIWHVYSDGDVNAAWHLADGSYASQMFKPLTLRRLDVDERVPYRDARMAGPL